MSKPAVWVIHHPPYTMFIEAPVLEEAEAMNPFRKACKPRKKKADTENVLSEADVRAILGSPGTYTQIASGPMQPDGTG